MGKSGSIKLTRLRAQQALALLGAGLSLFLAGCMTSESAAQLGRSEHPKVMAMHGGAYENAPLVSYVESVGKKVAAGTQMGTAGFTFTTLDAPMVNAFALPGGYTYVTRGLLALVNDEAELAGVLGHEMTHVLQNHTAERYNRAQAAGIGTLLVGLATGSNDLMNITGYGSQLFLMKYSRGQEFESDRIGVGLIHKAGYDPYAMGDFLAAMGAQSVLSAQIAGRDYDPGKIDYFSTHPNTSDRVQTAYRLAKERGAKPGEGLRNRNKYLQMIDGMLYGDSPDQGFVRGNRFSHPVLKFTFAASDGFTLQNSALAVTGRNKSNVALQFDGASDYRAGTTLADYIGKIWGPKLQVPVRSVRQQSINGLAMASGTAQARTNSGTLAIQLIAIALNSQTVYRFMVITPASQANELQAVSNDLMRSFRKLSDREAAALKPLWLRVVTVKSGDTVSGLARRMAFDDFREERFRTLNALGKNDTLRAGQKVKIVTE